MLVVPFVRDYMQKLHRDLVESVQGLSLEQLHWQPGQQTNHMAFLLWHYTRTVDNLVRFVLQRRSTVWMEEGWDQRFGLDSKAQGTGMAPEAAAQVRISSLEDFLTYMGQVWREADNYLATVDEVELNRVTLVKPLGELSVRDILGTSLLTHGFSHLGELWALRGLQGLRGTPL